MTTMLMPMNNGWYVGKVINKWKILVFLRSDMLVWMS